MAVDDIYRRRKCKGTNERTTRLFCVGHHWVCVVVVVVVERLRGGGYLHFSLAVVFIHPEPHWVFFCVVDNIRPLCIWRSSRFFCGI